MTKMNGFVSSSRTRFIRHRDIKHSEKEIKKETVVLQKTLEGWITLTSLDMFNQHISCTA